MARLGTTRTARGPPTRTARAVVACTAVLAAGRKGDPDRIPSEFQDWTNLDAPWARRARRVLHWIFGVDPILPDAIVREFARAYYDADPVAEAFVDDVYMTRGQVVDFFEKAKKSEAVGYENALRLDAESVINKGDSVTLYGDKTSAFPLFLAFSVPLDAKTGIRCEVSFRHLRQMGAFYGSKVTGEFLESGRVTGAKALTIDVESYDYVAKP